MKILITGPDGFIARNLTARLSACGYTDLMLCGRSTTTEELRAFAASCDAVLHLAGVNRPLTEQEYWTTNVGFTGRLLDYLKANRHCPHIIFASSIQAEKDNPYGKSKAQAERKCIQFLEEADARLTIYRFPNVFGKWCRPDYNSVVATFCYRIARNMPVEIHDADAVVELAYIDDVVDAMIYSLEHGGQEVYGQIHPVYQCRVGELADLIMSFRSQRLNYELPDTGSDFVKKMYSTYISYLADHDLKYPLHTHEDTRGSFTEFLRTDRMGQISVNVARSGIVKGNHWHHTKTEKFLVVKGKALIRLRHMVTNEILEYAVSEEKLEVVDIPPGYVHNITNTGKEDLVTIMWANETYEPERPDTCNEKV